MIVDYHTHTRLCKHALGGVEDYVRRALRLGFDEIGCSDHAPLPGNYDERHRMTIESYAHYAPSADVIAYTEESRQTQDRGTGLGFGVELGFIAGDQRFCDRFSALRRTTR
jgi:histidinol-phosphatase (PHP family)